MKILMIRGYPSYMSVKRNTYNIQEVGLAKALVQRGHLCDILFWTDKDEETVEIPVKNHGVVRVFYRHGVTLLKNAVFTACAELFEQYDILQTAEYNQIQSWLLSRRYPNKTVIYHGPYYCPFNKRYNWMARVFDLLFLKRYLKQGTGFIAKSRLAEAYLRSKGIRNVRAVGVGMDEEVLKTNAEDKLDFLDDILNNSDQKIMYIGRIEPRRNPDFLLEVLKALNLTMPVSLVLVGTGETEYVNAFFKKADALGVKDKIIYRERVEQKYMEQLYPCAGVFLLPTIYDIYGMVLLEAMYFKQAVVTTVNGGSDMMIKDGENGFVMKRFDAAKWSDAVLRLLKDEAYRMNVGIQANRTVCESFTWQALAGQFEQAYERKLFAAHD